MPFQEIAEIHGHSHGPELIAAFLFLRLAVDRERPAHLSNRSQIRIEQEQLVASPLRRSHGHAGVFHPGQFRIFRSDIHGSSDSRPGSDADVQDVPVETQTVPAGAVICPYILI